MKMQKEAYYFCLKNCQLLTNLQFYICKIVDSE